MYTFSLLPASHPLAIWKTSEAGLRCGVGLHQNGRCAARDIRATLWLFA